jgi:hypothetical protein
MLSESEIQRFANKIAEVLSKDEEVEFLRSMQEVTESIVSVLSMNMDEERRLNAECDKIMDQYAREIDRGSVDPHNMFLMIKKKLAKEKGVVL